MEIRLFLVLALVVALAAPFASAQGTMAVHVRLYSNGNTSNEPNHYCEVEVFGTSDK